MATLKEKHDEVRDAFNAAEVYLFGEDRVRAETGFYNEATRNYQKLGGSIERGFGDELERTTFIELYKKTGLYLTESSGKVQGYFDIFRTRLNQTIWLREIFARERRIPISARLTEVGKVGVGQLMDYQSKLWDSFFIANHSLKRRVKGGSKKMRDLSDILSGKVGAGFLQIHLQFEMAEYYIKDYLLEVKTALKKNIIDNPI
ncbi:hypothetical protein AUJ84_03915 [Candidatus Pacearchaeota archaeon CG1_02_32_132]|nr:MAG: hypothetical protein AUJ84_03915 [Candidatus Pacearchaeota archaeon CG1_02_32_132]